MKASQQASNLIREFEGLRLQAYQCPSGIWTIGYGPLAGLQRRRMAEMELYFSTQ